MKHLRKRLTYANVMSSIAVFLVLGGGAAFAAGQLGKNSVGSKQLKKNAVTSAKIKKNAVTGAKIRNGAITGAKVNAATLGVVPNATHAAGADNANTVGGQSVVKIFKVINAGETEVSVGSAGPFSFTATCQDANIDVKAHIGAGPAWVMEAGGEPGTPSKETTEEYDSGSPGEASDMYIDNLSGGGDSTYGITTFYGATQSGAVVSGVLGYDYDTFNGNPGNTCVVAGHLTAG